MPSAVLILVLLVGSIFGEPVFVGLFTGFKASDYTTRKTVAPVFEAVRASALAVNRSGGIGHGRELVLVECECEMDDNTTIECAKNFTRDYPQMVAWIGVFVDYQISLLSDIIESSDAFLIGPPIVTPQYRRMFSNHWIFTSSDPTTRLQEMARIVQTYHLKRIGFLVQTAFPGVADMIHQAEALAQQLGLQSTGIIFTNSSDHVWSNRSYFDWLTKMPQAIFIFLGGSASSLDPLVDILRRITKGSDGLSDDVYLLAIDWSIPVAELAIQFLKLSNLHYNTSRGRLIFSHSNPALTDLRYTAMQRAMTELQAYWNGSTSFVTSGTYATVGAQGWIAMQVLISALRSLDPQNMTKQSLRSRVFNSGVFEVDDMLFGMYNRPCGAGGMRAERGLFCACNEGYRTSEYYAYDTSALGNLRAIPELRTSYSFEECVPSSYAISSVLVYMTLEPASEALNRSAAMLLAGMTAQESIAKVAVSASFERISSSEALTAGQRAESIAQRVAERYVSGLFGFVLPAGSVDSVNVSGYPLFDPLYFPAVMRRPYTHNVVHMSASLEQELFVLAEYAVEQLLKPVHVMARGVEASAVVGAVQASVETFGASLASAGAVPDGASVVPSVLPRGGVVFVIGLRNSLEVSALLTLLASHPEAMVAVSFTELSVLYADFVACAASSPPTCAQVVFATALRNWNAPQLAGESQMMAEYFSGVNDTSLRGPLSLRGFMNSAAIRRVTGEMGTSPYLPSTLLERWYSTGVVALSTADYLGPYSALPCASVLKGEAVCEENAGARVVRVMSLADVTTNATNTSGALLVRTFSSATPPYVVAASSSGLGAAQLAGIVVGSTVLVLAFGALVVWSHLSKRNNRYAPTDPQRPVTIVFTDIQSSTALWARTPQAMGAALDQHHDIIRHLISKHKCYEVKTIGDAFMIACDESRRAVALAVELQHKLFAASWGDGEIDEAYRQMEAEKNHAPATLSPLGKYGHCWNGLRVRVGIHTGLADIRLDETTKGFDYYGNLPNMAARTESYGCGGQVVVTQDVVDALGDAGAAMYLLRPLGSAVLRGASNPIVLYDIVTVPGRVFPRAADEVSVKGPAANAGEAASEGSTADPNCVEAVTSVSSDGSLSPRDRQARMAMWERTAQPVIATMTSLLGPAERTAMLRTLCAKWHTQPTYVEEKNFDDAAIEALSRRIGRVVCERVGAHQPPIKLLVNGRSGSPRQLMSREGSPSPHFILSPRRSSLYLATE